MSEQEAATTQPASSESEGSPRRRRRRRRRNRSDGDSGGGEGRRSRRDRRRDGSDGDAAVAVADSGRRPSRRRGRRRRGRPAGGGMARRRRMSRNELEELSTYFATMSEPLVAALYTAMGGQPNRVPDSKRLIQLAVRALAQGDRLGNLLKGLLAKDRQALAILLQSGGLAHAGEFHRELSLTLGGGEPEWRRVMQTLGGKGLVCASETQESDFFYLVPEPLVDPLLKLLKDEMSLSTFEHPEISPVDERPFSPPLDFSITTLAAYLDQAPPKMTQQQEIFKVHKEELDTFFAQLWDPNSELFSFHIDFLMLHGLIELRGDRLSVNRDTLEEWLNLDAEDQRELIFRALEQRMPYSEWVLWAVHLAKGEWVPEQPLQALYRRWQRGEDWRKRFHQNEYAATRSAERESFTFAPLVNAGMLDLGTWGQEKFYRLTPRAKELLDPPEDDGFSQFYLTPNFEIMAPAGLAPIVLFRIGEIAELIGCDRANTYRITQPSIERATQNGWRNDEVLNFLREGSQIGLPENVESTLIGWMGAPGDVEFHEVTLMTIPRAAIRKLEAAKEAKPFIVHRFAAGLYAVDSFRLAELRTALRELGFHPNEDTRQYPGSVNGITAREKLQLMVANARDASEDPLARAQAADTPPDALHPVPGSGVSGRKTMNKRKKKLPPRTTPERTTLTVMDAIRDNKNLELVYLTRDDQRTLVKVEPERLASTRDGHAVLIARDIEKDARLTYRIAQIERLRSMDRRKRSGDSA